MFGTHSKVPAFLINQHSIATVAEAEAYIARLNGTSSLINQLIAQLRLRETKGIIAPDFVFPHVIRDSRNILTGAPFDGGPESTLLADFNSKISGLDLSDIERGRLSREAEQALLHSVQPAYLELRGYMETLQMRATHDAGVWKLPRGEEFYENRLQRVTTTGLTADEIHELGLNEVTRIHAWTSCLSSNPRHHWK